LVLKHIKQKSESHFSSAFDGVVIGRPVNYMGANSPAQNEQAIYSCDTLAGQAHLGKLDVHRQYDLPTNTHHANSAGIEPPYC
jgi:hypothetical protein